MEQPDGRADAKPKIVLALGVLRQVRESGKHEPEISSQLDLAIGQLEAMLEAMERPNQIDISWLSQMVADQWDPWWPPTALVLEATSAFSRGVEPETQSRDRR